MSHIVNKWIHQPFSTSASLAWDPCLLTTNINIYFMIDIYMLNMVENIKRSGLCVVCCRLSTICKGKLHVCFNLHDCNPYVESNYLVYADCRNLQFIIELVVNALKVHTVMSAYQTAMAKGVYCF